MASRLLIFGATAQVAGIDIQLGTKKEIVPEPKVVADAKMENKLFIQEEEELVHAAESQSETAEKVAEGEFWTNAKWYYYNGTFAEGWAGGCIAGACCGAGCGAAGITICDRIVY